MKPLIQIENLHFRIHRPQTKSLGALFKVHEGFELYHGLNLRFERKTHYLVLGDNGAGKTTLFRLIAGILIPDSGQITRESDVAICLAKSAIFFPRLSLRDNLRFASETLLKKSVSEGELTKIVKFSGIDVDLEMISRGLSTGMSARLLISLFVHSGAKHIVFDETFAHVQPSFVDEVVEFCETQGISLIIVTHTREQFSKLPAQVITLQS